MQISRTIAAAIVAASALAVPLRAQTPAPVSAAPATIDQVAWISGAWTGTLKDRTIEQHWMTPLGGSMVAMYRSVRDNKPTLYELLAIEQEGNTLVLRIKHFAPGPGLVGQEAKDESSNHTLVSLGDRKAVFEASTPTGPVRVTFTSPDASALSIVVERQRDGKAVATDFKYTRVSR